MIRNGISARSLAYVRGMASAQMLQTCVVERVADPGYDPTTLIATSGSRTTIYTGACRIWQEDNPAAMQLGDTSTEFLLYQTVLSLPWNTPDNQIPHLHDEMQVVTSPTDDTWVGKRFRIQSFYKGGQMRPTRSFVVTAMEKRPS